MSKHRFDKSINELKNYFSSVLDWVSSVFSDVEDEMRGLEWGRMYEAFHKKAYDPKKISKQTKKLYGDPYVKNRKGIFEYILGGSKDSKLLDVRIFDEAIKKSVYSKQTSDAKIKKKSKYGWTVKYIHKNQNFSKLKIQSLQYQLRVNLFVDFYI